MCYMLSTTPSGRGELLIQQGELAGRSYRFEAIVCQNPTCQCDRVTLKCFTETPEARPGVPISVCLEMDLERQEIANLEELKGQSHCMASGERGRSEEHTSELQSRLHLVCRLLLE